MKRNRMLKKFRQLRSRLIEILNVPQEVTPVSTYLRPCLGEGAYRRAGVGRVEKSGLFEHPVRGSHVIANVRINEVLTRQYVST
jgi:hypothetical protein